MLLSGVKWCSY